MPRQRRAEDRGWTALYSYKVYMRVSWQLRAARDEIAELKMKPFRPQ